MESIHTKDTVRDYQSQFPAFSDQLVMEIAKRFELSHLSLENAEEENRAEYNFPKTNLFTQNIYDIIKKHDYDPANFEVAEGLPGIYKIPLNVSVGEPRLPTGYGYKGGTARALLERTLGIDPDATARDYDVVALPEFSSFELNEIIGEDIIGDDYRNNPKKGGVEVIPGMSEYFTSRDLTINEVMTMDGYIYLTKECLRDTFTRTLRITKYEDDLMYDSQREAPYRIMAKIVRLISESMTTAEQPDMLIADKDTDYFHPGMLPHMYTALQLDRALEKSAEVAQIYVDFLIEHNMTPGHVNTPVKLARYVNDNLLTRKPYYYKNLPDSETIDPNTIAN